MIRIVSEFPLHEIFSAAEPYQILKDSSHLPIISLIHSLSIQFITKRPIII